MSIIDWIGVLFVTVFVLLCIGVIVELVRYWSARS